MKGRHSRAGEITLPCAGWAQTHHTRGHCWPLLWGRLGHSTVSMPGSWDVLCVSRSCWDIVGMLIGQDLTFRKIRRVGNKIGSTACTQPPGVSPKMGLLKASSPRRCGWSCSRGKAGKSHSPIHALVPCGAMLMKWKSGGAKAPVCHTAGGWGHIPLEQKHCALQEHLQAADFL